jgi:hypothetical protein
MRCLRYLAGIAIACSVVGSLGTSLPPSLAASPQSLHPAFAGAWRLDPGRSTEDPADWRRLGDRWKRTIPCQPNLLTQDDFTGGRHLLECETRAPGEPRTINRGPHTETVESTLGTALVAMAAEIVTEASATAAVITGGPGPHAVTFSTLDAAQTLRVGDHAIRSRARWRNGALEQTLAGKDHDLSFRVVRVFRPAADGQSMTITTHVESPRLEPRIKDITRVYTRVR